MPVALANDANCFALSEAVDGAAAGASVVFGVILGTGVGGGIVVERPAARRRQRDRRRMGPQPAAALRRGRRPAATCGCGRVGCIESWLNGAALARDYARLTGRVADGPRDRAPRRGRRCRRARHARALPRAPRHGARRGHQPPRPRGDRARRRPLGAARPLRRGAAALAAAGVAPAPAPASSPPASAPRAACAAPPGSAR